MHAYVVEEAGTITDLFAFYTQSAQILSDSPHKQLLIAQSYLNISPTFRLARGLQAMMFIAKGLGADLFQCPEMLENTAKVLSDLRFEELPIVLHYYLFNWKMRPVESSQIGLNTF
jgi:hypothetical protein